MNVELGVQMNAAGSVLISTGNTKVICAVTIEERVPGWLRGKGAGWVTAEYAMLPGSTDTRARRETGRIGGRTHEIQRLIGRSLRAVTQLDLLGERTFTVDCDVLQADGGTRTASITGGYIALALAMQKLVDAGAYGALPLECAVAATSVGVVQGESLLDLCYTEDSTAEVDFNVVRTGRGEYVEVQGTAEGGTFSRIQMDGMLELADAGIEELFALQQETLAAVAQSV
ncbi:MAG: ribonuclease PH [Chloroflexi bacterium]|nr:MAG: ribonuclease PH [Chloroflexota bacterium]